MKAAFRSRVFYFLLFLSLLAAVLIPGTVRGDGTAVGTVQAGLTYSLQAVGVLLSLAAVWLGCAGLSREIESYNLHLVVTKPVAAWRLWLGKCLAVVTVTVIPLLLCGVVVYGVLQWKLRSGEFTEAELGRAQREVLVGRRTYRPEQPDFASIAESRYQDLQAEGRLDPGHDREAVLRELGRQAKAASTEVGFGQVRSWLYNGIGGTAEADRLFFRYRVFVDSTSSSQQRETFGVWRVANPAVDGEAEGDAFLPQRVMGGSFHELAIPLALVSEDGRLVVGYLNQDPRASSVIFQVEDGPSILVPVASFAYNYVTGLAILVVRIVVFAVLGCAMGAMFSSPVAVFVSMVYLLLSVLVDAVFRSGGIASGGGSPFGASYGFGLAYLVDAVVISLREFDVPGRLAQGRLVGWGLFARVALFQLLLRGLPLAALSIFVLRGRELGKVVRK